MPCWTPVKLIVDNYPEDKTEYFDVANNPNREANDTTTRKVAFTRELWIENEDFAEVPPPKFKRLTVGGEVRLMGAYIVKCTGVEKNADGSIAAIHCTADLETGNGNPSDGRKVKGTIHWVSAAHCVDAEVRLYDKLFTEANMNGIPEGSDYKDYLNPESVVRTQGCKLEESLKDATSAHKASSAVAVSGVVKRYAKPCTVSMRALCSALMGRQTRICLDIIGSPSLFLSIIPQTARRYKGRFCTFRRIP